VNFIISPDHQNSRNIQIFTSLIIDYKTLQYLSYKQHLIDVHAALKHIHVDMIEMYKAVTIEYDATICLNTLPLFFTTKLW